MDQQTLQRGLLDVSGLETGYAAEPRLLGGATVHPCGVKFDEPPHTGAEVAFSRGGLGGPFLVERAHSYQPGQATAYLQQLDHAGHSCTTFGSGENSANIAALAFPQLGDASSAFRITASSGGIVIDDVFVRVGATVLQIGYGGLGGTDSSQTERFARQAVQKLQGAQ